MSPVVRNLLKMGGLAVALWFFFAILTPRLVTLSSAWQRYDAAQEQYGLDSGALYYSNVPATQEAEDAVRRAVREGMRQRRMMAVEH
ncbi:hypothetical protein [uncultured Desulfovibrio sp.]|uniref:hypothetical protein n=1 Tax=uncultured Desulfovibrio sp. TaxID=167968 RepID=UPI0026188DDE|nr:hypothetical protein [uncultured Desulfovibrio sp.]